MSGRTLSLPALMGSARRLQPLRRLVQLASLLLFFYLVVAAAVPLQGPLPVDLFFRADPLVMAATSLAAREPAPYALWAIPLVLATVFLGRFFCGWLCPLGTTLDLFRFDPGRKRFDYPRLRGGKHVLLLLLFVGAALGMLLLTALDPITLYLRAASTGVLPALDLALTAVLLQLFQAGIVPDLIARIDELLRPTLLPAQPYTYRLSLLLLALLAGVVALNLLTPRFWCRYLCPLGALLSLLGRATPIQKRVGSQCTSCGKCVTRCRMAAVSARGFRSDPAECVQCLACLDECPEGAITLERRWQSPRYNPARRRFLAGLGMGVAGVVALRVDASAAGQDHYLVRPPGAPADFLRRCIRCSQCIKVCPTAALQPAGLEAGWEGLWTPVLVGRLGYCEWTCNACGQVCPTAAIQPLSLEEKRETFIGTAYIDQNRCLPWADQRDCIICEEMCPLPRKAIILEPVELEGEDGERRLIKRPRVLRHLCIGCAICEYRCPVPREAAIRIYATSDLLLEQGGVGTQSAR